MGLDLPDDENPFVYDPDRAKELWAMAGKEPGEKLTLYYHQYNATHTTYTVALGASIAEALDIEVEVLKVPDISILYSMSGFVNPVDIQKPRVPDHPHPGDRRPPCLRAAQEQVRRPAELLRFQ